MESDSHLWICIDKKEGSQCHKPWRGGLKSCLWSSSDIPGQPSNQKSDEMDGSLIKDTMKKFVAHEGQNCLVSVYLGSDYKNFLSHHHISVTITQLFFSTHFVADIPIYDRVGHRNHVRMYIVQVCQLLQDWWMATGTLGLSVFSDESANWTRHTFLKTQNLVFEEWSCLIPHVYWIVIPKSVVI